MANGNVFPSATQGGLTRGASVILETMLRRRELGQRDRQLEQQEKALLLEEQAAAMERLMNFAPFLPGDAPIAELPFLHDDIRTVFGDVDPTNTGDIGAISLNQTDLAKAVEERMKGILSELPDDSPFFQRGISKLLTGEPVSEEELEARDAAAVTERSIAEASLEGLGSLMRDPKARSDLQRRFLGLEQPTRIVLDGREIAFSTEGAASISAQLAMHQDELTWRYSQIDQEDVRNIAAEFTAQLNEADMQIGPAAAERIIQTWNTAVTGDFEPGQDPFTQMALKAEEDGEWDFLAAIKLWNGVIDSGDQALRQFMGSTESGQRVLLTTGMLNHLQESTGFTGEELRQLAPGMLEFFKGAGAAQIENPMFDFGGPRFTLPDLPGGQEGGERPRGSAVLDQSGGGGETAPTDQDTNAQTEAQIGQIALQMQADAEALARGEIAISALREKYQDPALVTAIVRASQRIRR